MSYYHCTDPTEHIANKEHKCTWCGEIIRPKETYVRWFCYKSALQVKMHIECDLAADEYTCETGQHELPINYSMFRGCACDPTVKDFICDCRCNYNSSLRVKNNTE